MTQFDAYILVTLSVFKTKSLKFAAPGYLSIVFVTAATLTGFSLFTMLNIVFFLLSKETPFQALSHEIFSPNCLSQNKLSDLDSGQK